MNGEIPATLVSLEKRLLAEARSFKQRANTLADADSLLAQTVRTLLRDPGCKLSATTTLLRLERMRAAQRRWSRGRHPAYDLNRHILLERTCKALAAYQAKRLKRPFPGRPDQKANMKRAVVEGQPQQPVNS